MTRKIGTYMVGTDLRFSKEGDQKLRDTQEDVKLRYVTSQEVEGGACGSWEVDIRSGLGIITILDLNWKKRLALSQPHIRSWPSPIVFHTPNNELSITQGPDSRNVIMLEFFILL